MKDITKRRNSLDALRGIAVIMLIWQHLGIFLWRQPWLKITDIMYEYPVFFGLNTIALIGAPIFFALVGIGAVFLINKSDVCSRVLIKRGLIIFTLGYILNIMIPEIFSWGSWYALHLIGFFLIAAPLFKNFSSRVLIFLVTAILISTVLIQNGLNTPSVLWLKRMSDIKLPGGVFRLAIAEGNFPIFPWFAFMLVGFIAGRWLIDNKLKKITIMSIAALLTGLILSMFNFVGLEFAKTGFFYRAFKLELGIMPALIPITLILISLTLFLIIIFTLIESRLGFVCFKPFVCLGRISLTVLVVHFVIFVRLGVYFNFYRMLTEAETLLIITGVIVLCAGLSMYWKQAGYKYSLEWFLRKITG